MWKIRCQITSQREKNPSFKWYNKSKYVTLLVDMKAEQVPGDQLLALAAMGAVSCGVLVQSRLNRPGNYPHHRNTVTRRQVQGAECVAKQETEPWNN